MSGEHTDLPTVRERRRRKRGIEGVGRLVWGILSARAVGREKAMPRAELLKHVRFHAPYTSDRQMRRAIVWITESEHKPIAAGDGKPFGYYVMKLSERDHLRRSCLKRIAALARRMRATDDPLAARIMAFVEREDEELVQQGLFR